MSLKRYVLALLVLPVILAPVAGRADPLYTASFLPGTTNFTAYGMNNAGQVVGTDGGVGLHAVYYDGFRREIDNADAESSIGYAINNTGVVTGVYLSRTDSAAHGFTYQNGALRDVGAGTAVYGINDAGNIVGGKLTAAGSTGFIEKNGVITELGNLGTGQYGRALGVNDAGQVVGYSTLAAGPADALRHPFLYSGGALTDLGALGQGSDNSAVDINNAGQIVGYSEAADGTTHAFLYEAGVMHDVGGFGTSQMVIHSLNEHGRFVGTALTGASGDVPFIYLGGTIIDLNTLIDTALGWEIYAAYANNDFDQITAAGCHDHMCGLVRLDLIGAIPEPAAAWLLAPGLLLLAVARRRPFRCQPVAAAA